MKLSKQVFLTVVICAGALELFHEAVAADGGSVPLANNLKQKETGLLLDINQAELAPDKPNLLIDKLVAICDFYDSIGLGGKSFPYLERAYSLAKEKNSSRQTDIAKRLGERYYQSQKYAQAEPFLKECVTRKPSSGASQISATNDHFERLALIYLGDTELQLGKLKDAGEYLERYRKAEEDNATRKMKGQYEKRFLEVYVAYLLKAGRTADATVWQKRLESENARRICYACGRG